jgi:hypothetical protein
MGGPYALRRSANSSKYFASKFLLGVGPLDFQQAQGGRLADRYSVTMNTASKLEHHTNTLVT